MKRGHEQSGYGTWQGVLNIHPHELALVLVGK